MKFDINDHVWIRLTDKGREILREDHRRLNAMFPHLTDHGYDGVPAEVKGWSKWQMWKIMKDFGPHM